MKKILINTFFVLMITRPLIEYIVLIFKNHDEMYARMIMNHAGLILVHAICTAIGIIGLVLYNDPKRDK